MDFDKSNFDRHVVSFRDTPSWKRIVFCAAEKSIPCVLVCWVFATVMAFAQGVGTSGEITGTVTDSAGGVLLKATITVVDTQTGLSRAAEPNSTGQYRVTGLSPTTYNVTAA